MGYFDTWAATEPVENAVAAEHENEHTSCMEDGEASGLLTDADASVCALDDVNKRAIPDTVPTLPNADEHKTNAETE